MLKNIKEKVLEDKEKIFWIVSGLFVGI